MNCAASRLRACLNTLRRVHTVGSPVAAATRFDVLDRDEFQRMAEAVPTNPMRREKDRKVNQVLHLLRDWKPTGRAVCWWVREEVGMSRPRVSRYPCGPSVSRKPFTTTVTQVGMRLPCSHCYSLPTLSAPVLESPG